jgi:hypothetical protein
MSMGPQETSTESGGFLGHAYRFIGGGDNERGRDRLLNAAGSAALVLGLLRLSMAYEQVMDIPDCPSNTAAEQQNNIPSEGGDSIQLTDGRSIDDTYGVTVASSSCTQDPLHIHDVFFVFDPETGTFIPENIINDLAVVAMLWGEATRRKYGGRLQARRMRDMFLSLNSIDLDQEPNDKRQS